MTIRPHNSRNPVAVNSRCYLCDGEWKIMLLTEDERERWGLVVKCRSCGLISCATREAAGTLTSLEPEAEHPSQRRLPCASQ
jgi:hypothetical protein